MKDNNASISIRVEIDPLIKVIKDDLFILGLHSNYAFQFFQYTHV